MMQRDFSGGPVFKTPCLPVQEVRVLFLVRELRSYLSHDAKKKKKKSKKLHRGSETPKYVIM